MTKDELRALIGTELNNSYGANSGELSEEVSKALDYYHGEPFGNEQEGKSSVISRDVMDVIEWIMPSLMRVFTSNERAVVFDPVQPGDEEAAKQETDIVNHIFYKENDGFLNLYTFFKDALLSKNGILKVFWDPAKETEREEYKGLTMAEMEQLLFSPDVDPIEHTENGVDDHDLAIIRTVSNGRAKVMPIPPEEFLISKDADCIDPSKARFTCHKTYKTRSQLMEMGVSRKKAYKLPAYPSVDREEIKQARDNLKDSLFDDAPHESQRLVEVHECYYRVDFNNDGIAELRQVTLAGDEIIFNEETDRCPFIAITPIILTHKFYGLSVADLIMDIQLIKSTLMRGVLDNTYLANNGRTAVQDGMVNLDDLLTSRSGGVVRTLGPPSQVMSPIPYNQLPPQSFQILEKMDMMRKERTGISQDSMGLESNVLAHGRTGVVNQSFDMSRMRTELIARVFAEVGIKPLMRELHAIIQKNQDKEKVIQLRGKWVPVKPDEWKTRYNMTVNVGLGSGNRDKQLASIMQIIDVQKQMFEKGMFIKEDNFYNALEKLVEFTGLGDVSQYFPDPEQKPPPQPKGPSPEELLIQAQIEVAKAQAMTSQAEMETNRQEAIWKHEERMKELIDKDNRERFKMELEYNRNVPGGLNAVR